MGCRKKVNPRDFPLDFRLIIFPLPFHLYIFLSSMKHIEITSKGITFLKRKVVIGNEHTDNHRRTGQ